MGAIRPVRKVEGIFLFISCFGNGADFGFFGNR